MTPCWPAPPRPPRRPAAVAVFKGLRFSPGAAAAASLAPLRPRWPGSQFGWMQVGPTSLKLSPALRSDWCFALRVETLGISLEELGARALFLDVQEFLEVSSRWSCVRASS